VGCCALCPHCTTLRNACQVAKVHKLCAMFLAVLHIAQCRRLWYNNMRR
jgi:hypothetical protein